MRRAKLAWGLAAIFLFSLLVAAGTSLSYSDGYAGGSGAIPERFRDCQGVEFCKFRPSYCGTCHGQSDDMWRQEGSNPTPQERVRTTFKVNNDDQAGTRNGQWEYEPNKQYTLTITLADSRGERSCGQFACGGFNLNASAGTLTKVSDGDGTVRITGPGNFTHGGSESPQGVYETGQRYGSPVEDESSWAGEATHTGSRTGASGNDVLTWRVRWTAPAAYTEPRGVAFVMTGMLANGDGFDSCVYEQCNQSKGYAPQDQWDWYSFMIPRRLLCEEGAYDNFGDCEKAIYDFILPPAPPLNTSCPPEDPRCATNTNGEPRGTPLPPVLGFVAALVAVAWGLRRRASER